MSKVRSGTQTDHDRVLAIVIVLGVSQGPVDPQSEGKYSMQPIVG
jgi:hypothetical protein